MADILATFTNFVNSPPGQVVAGAALAGIVWKFFDKVEAVLMDQTKFEIAVWLVGVKTADKVPWPQTFIDIFDRVFPFSLMGFVHSCIASLCAAALTEGVAYAIAPARFNGIWEELPKGTANVLTFWIAVTYFLNCWPDYFSLLETRYILGRVAKSKSGAVTAAFLSFDFLFTTCLGMLVAWFVLRSVGPSFGGFDETGAIIVGAEPTISQYVIRIFSTPTAICFVYPAYFTSIWLWLYAGSGFLLKFARRFDLGFDWFNRKFDIEKKPLSAIGLVAGSLVAILYWSWAAFRHFCPA